MPNIKIILTNPVSLDFTDKTNNALRKKIDFDLLSKDLISVERYIAIDNANRNITV